jgi:hypothetical protein
MNFLPARDAGQVPFFCGAGISQENAKLPNFSVLAERVLALLGSAMDSPARRLFTAAREFEKTSGLTGLVAAPRVMCVSALCRRQDEPGVPSGTAVADAVTLRAAER